MQVPDEKVCIVTFTKEVIKIQRQYGKYKNSKISKCSNVHSAVVYSDTTERIGIKGLYVEQKPNS